MPCFVWYVIMLVIIGLFLGWRRGKWQLTQNDGWFFYLLEYRFMMPRASILVPRTLRNSTNKPAVTTAPCKWIMCASFGKYMSLWLDEMIHGHGLWRLIRMLTHPKYVKWFFFSVWVTWKHLPVDLPTSTVKWRCIKACIWNGNFQFAAASTCLLVVEKWRRKKNDRRGDNHHNASNYWLNMSIS